MKYKSLKDCVEDLDKNGMLIRVKEEVSPDLEMAAIHRRVFEAGGPAVLYENVKGCSFPALSNLYGSRERVHFMFRDTWKVAEELIRLKPDPLSVLKKPSSLFRLPFEMLSALPRKVKSGPVLFSEIPVSALPQVKSWPDDGGPFVTLPQVLTEDPDKPGIMQANIGMYRIQLGGNDYVQDKEIGLHYQLHRGIGVHQTKYRERDENMKVSVMVGGPPSLSFAAVMPLPEGLSEALFAGLLGGRRFRYTRKDGYLFSTDADFVITGEVCPGENKPEGPFGDHLGYYSLRHPFPLMKVHKVFHRKDAIWPFTVVGRPPQEDTFFGDIIHELTGPVMSSEIPGLDAVNAVDAAGVHPLLLATARERYTPYSELSQPQELLTTASRIIGTGQLSLAKYLWIAQTTEKTPPPSDIEAFFRWMLERIDLSRDIHFFTKTTIDTLDYSGEGLNSGSKVIIAAIDKKVRELGNEIPDIQLPDGFSDLRVVMPGVMAVKGSSFETASSEGQRIEKLLESLGRHDSFRGINCRFPLVVLCDDSDFLAEKLNNFLWVTFTRSNPSHDITGVNQKTENKHWGAGGSMIIDARIKPHHAPPLIEDPKTERRVDELGAPGGSLHGII